MLVSRSSISKGLRKNIEAIPAQSSKPALIRMTGMPEADSARRNASVTPSSLGILMSLMIRSGGLLLHGDPGRLPVVDAPDPIALSSEQGTEQIAQIAIVVHHQDR